MIKIKHVLLFTAILILLVGVACASDVSEDTTSTGSITEKAAIQDTYKVSDNANIIQAHKINENIKSNDASNNMDENSTKTIDKTTNGNLKTATAVTNWKELQTAVKDANKDITITLGNGTYKNSGTIRLNNSKIKLTIDGNGQTIDGNNQQVFIIEKGASLVLNNITIKNGESQLGGTIINQGTLTITKSTITKSETSTLVGFGGAIFNNGILNITQSTFTDNRASLGGAIYNNNSGKIDITQSTFTGNSAVDEVSYGAGGAIKNWGTLTITQSTFTKGIAHTGGAIDSYGRFTITNSTLANNRAKYQGGAIYSSTEKSKVIGSNFTSNRAQEGGAVFARGYINLTDNRFTENTATQNQETIDLYGYTNGIFDNNVYKSTSISFKTINLKTKDNKNTYYYGEDVVLNLTLALNHKNYYDKDILKRLDDITIYVNGKKTATTTYKNYTLSNLKPGNYSVYYNTCKGTSNTVKFTVNPITNWEELNAAVHYAENQTKDVTLKLGKGYYTNTGTINWTNPKITLSIDGNGQLLDGNRQLVFHIGSTASMNLKNIIIDDARSDDGAIFNEGTLTITDSVLQKNTATYDGGAIKNIGILNINNCTLANNTAAQYGGAIISDRDKFTVAGSTFINNHAKTGGAVFSYGNANLTGNAFINNTADNKETIDLYRYWEGHVENNTYESTDIALKNMKLAIKDNQTIFNLGEDVVLNYSFALKSPRNYDKDVMEQLDEITIYVNDAEYATASTNENYPLSLSKPGEYTVYYEICNQKSNTVNFTVKSLITNWQQLREAVKDAEDKTEDVTLYLGEGNYTNTGTITWSNPDIELTIDGWNQTIDGNQLQVFKITDGASFVLKNITITNAKSDYGGAISNDQAKLTVADSTFINNHANNGGAIFSYGNTNLTGNKFINNTADNKETIDLYNQTGCFDNNVYESTDISLKTYDLSIKNNQSIFNPGEVIVLNYSIALEHPNYYDADILERLDDITLYINGIENVTTTYKNYTLYNLKPGEYSVYYKTCNQESNTVNFTVTPITNWQQLSDAVNDAKGQKINITLTLWDGNYTNTGTITWNNKKIVLTIEGNGQTIDGNQLQVFSINNGASLVLKNITIRDAKSYNGAAIENQGTLTITQSTLTNNTATLFGGAIINNGILNITDSKLTNNTARDGGAIFNNKTLSITQSTLTNNKADNDDGGAIYNRETLTITDSTLNNNQAKIYGGAIESYGTVKIINSKLNNNDALSGGAISSITGILTITQSTLNNNTVTHDGGAIYNHGTLSISNSTLSNNIARGGGAIINKIYRYFNLVNTNFTNNHANEGGAIRSPGYVNLTGSIFTNNTADNGETIYLLEEDIGRFNADVYESTDISLKRLNLSIKDGQTLFNKGEDVVLNYSIALEHPNYYDKDILERLDDITIYINGIENVTTKYEDYPLSNLQPGEYTVYIKTCNHESNTVSFKVASVSLTTEVTPTHLIITAKDYKGNPVTDGTITTNLTTANYYPDENGHVFIPLTMKGGPKSVNISYTDDTSRIKSSTNATFDIFVPNEKINMTTWDIVIEQARGVNLSALIYHKNKTVNDGETYFIIDDKPILAENGSVLYVPVKDSWSELPYKIPSNMSIGNHTLSAVYVKYVTAWNRDDKTLTVIDGYVNLTTEVTPTHLIITAKDYEGNPVTEGTITTNLTTDNYYPDENGRVFLSLSNLKGGEKCVNISYTDDTSDIKSSTNVTFDIFVPSEKINVTTWDVEMVRGRGVTFTALVYEKNKTVNYGEVYFIIDDKPILDENGSVLYVPVKDSRADLPYDMPTDIGLGNHTLTAVYKKYVTAWNKDDKTLTIIKNIPEGAGDENKTPSEEEKEETHKQETRPHKSITKHAKAIQSIIPTSHLVYTANKMITLSDTITLGKLNDIFDQTFINGHLLLYIDGQLVYNGTVGDDLSTVLLEIIEKFLGKHEIKVEFTDADGKTNTYTENVTIT